MLSDYILIIAAVLFGVAKGQSTLPPELLAEVDESQIKSIQNASEILFKEKCDKNGGPNAYGEVQNALKELNTCITGLVNTTVLMKELEEAKPNGKVDEVFKKYCAKIPDFKECFKNTAEKASNCFEKEEKDNMKTIYDIRDQLADFICYKDGDRIALFIAEMGPECIQEKRDELQACANSTLGSDYQINTKDLTANVIPKIVFGEKECGKFDVLQKCVVDALQGCETPTTANIADSLFKFVKQATPCSKFQAAPAQKTNSAGELYVTFSTLLMLVTVNMLA